jgi:DNA-directed RNA polymerase specialized sigma24 family protein
VTEVPRIQIAIEKGGVESATRLLPLVYEELRLDKLAGEDQQKAEPVKLRCLVGLPSEEASEILGVSLPTAKRWWTYAQAWLFQEIQSPAVSNSTARRR